MSAAADWLLIFPPLVSSNWGNYYPSTAVLSAALAERGDRVRQLDLNAEFFDYLIDQNRLEQLEHDYRGRRTGADEIPSRAAALMLRRFPSLAVDERNRHRSLDGNIGGEMIAELGRAFHLDLPIQQITSPDFIESDVARAYEEFFSQSGLERALDGPLDAIGLSVPMGPQLAPAVVLSRFIRSRRPDVRIVVGGPTVTLMQPALLAPLIRASFDAAVRFEGEAAVVELSRQLAEKRWDPGSVAGVYAPEGMDPAWTTSQPPPVRKLRVPTYAPELLDRLADPRLGIIQARGCYWGKCSYCDFVELYSEGRRYDQRPADRMADEVEELQQRHGVRKFWLITEALPPKQGHRFARVIQSRGLRIDWRSFAMVEDGFTVPLLEDLRASGCTSLTIGLETTNSRVLKLMRKKARRDDNLAFLDRVREASVSVDLNLIPNLPTTTRAEALEVLEDLRPYMQVMRTVAVFPFEATASSEVGRSPASYGLDIVGQCTENGEPFPHGQAQYASNRLTYCDAGMTPDELLEVHAAYQAFAAQVQRTGALRDRCPDSGPGYRLHADVAVLSEPGSTVVYHWSDDRALRIGREWFEILSWLSTRTAPVLKSDLANQLASQMSLQHETLRVTELLGRLEDAGMVQHGE